MALTCTGVQARHHEQLGYPAQPMPAKRHEVFSRRYSEFQRLDSLQAGPDGFSLQMGPSTISKRLNWKRPAPPPSVLGVFPEEPKLRKQRCPMFRLWYSIVLRARFYALA